MMGATLPTLTRHFARGEHLSGAFGRLYALNTFGAIIGTLLAGLVLLLVLSLLMMGGATFAIGLLPTYASIGIAAPALLALCRGHRRRITRAVQ